MFSLSLKMSEICILLEKNIEKLLLLCSNYHVLCLCQPDAKGKHQIKILSYFHIVESKECTLRYIRYLTKHL